MGGADVGRYRARRTISYGLVVFLFLVSVWPASGQAPRPDSGRAVEREFSVKPWREVRRSGSIRLHDQVWSLLLFLPGPLVFVSFLAFRKRRIGLVLVLFSLLGSVESQMELVLKAEQQFNRGDIESALASYQRIEAWSENSGLLYNMALCSHVLDRPGQAIYFLRKSLRIDPHDRVVRSTLNQLEKRYGLETQPTPQPPVNPEVFYLLLLIFTNLSFVLAAFLYRTREVRLLILLVLMGTLMIGSLLMFFIYHAQERKPLGVVAVEAVSLKKIPELEGRDWILLKPGTVLSITGEAGDFYLVETGLHLKGWVQKKTLLLD